MLDLFANCIVFHNYNYCILSFLFVVKHEVIISLQYSDYQVAVWPLLILKNPIVYIVFYNHLFISLQCHIKGLSHLILEFMYYHCYKLET